METIKQEHERLTREDVIIQAQFGEEDTEQVVIDPTDFHLRFFVRGRTAEVLCSRDGSEPPQNCRIEEDGTVTCFLPKNTFPPGPLWLEDMDTTPEHGFEDGTFETIGRMPTGIEYIV